MLYPESRGPSSAVPDVPLYPGKFREGVLRSCHVLWLQNKFNRKHPFLCSIRNRLPPSVPSIARVLPKRTGAPMSPRCSARPSCCISNTASTQRHATTSRTILRRVHAAPEPHSVSWPRNPPFPTWFCIAFYLPLLRGFMKNRSQNPTATSGVPASLSPQTSTDLCEMDRVDCLPLLAVHPDEQRTLMEHVQQLTAGLQTSEGTVVLRDLLAKRIAVLDVEVQRLTFIQETMLRSEGTSRESLQKVKDVSRVIASTHKRFIAASELYRRLAAPSVTLKISNAENVAVLKGNGS